MLQLFIAALLYQRFDGTVAGLQFATDVPWIRDWGVGYRIGLDGLNVLLVSLTFCFLHFSPHQPPLVMLWSLLFSLFACVWALLTGNIWGVMGWHAGWNWLLSTGFELPVTGIDAHLPALLVALRPHGVDALTGGARGPEGSYLCIAFFIAALAWVQWRKRRGVQHSLPTGR